MNTASKAFEAAAKQGKTRKPYLQLGIKQEGGGVQSTGAHTIVLVKDERGNGTDPITQQPREELHVTVTEDGVEKMWNIPLKDKEGNLHYLVQSLAQYKEGETITVEMKRKGIKNYIDVRQQADPFAEQNENGAGDSPIAPAGAVEPSVPVEEVDF